MMADHISDAVATLRELARQHGARIALDWSAKEAGQLVRVYSGNRSSVPVATFRHLHEARQWLEGGGAWKV